MGFVASAARRATRPEGVGSEGPRGFASPSGRFRSAKGSTSPPCAVTSNGGASAPSDPGSRAGSGFTFSGSTCSIEAMRRVRVLNSIALRKPTSFSGSGAGRRRSSRAMGSGTFSSSATSLRESFAWSMLARRVSRRLGCLISPARSSSASRLPYSLIRAAAVLRPMPGTPGTLSDVSPMSARASPIWFGCRPSHLAMMASRSRLRSGLCPGLPFTPDSKS